MTTIVVDDFQRADGPLGRHWKTVTGNSSPQILSHQVHPGLVGRDSYAFYRHADWNVDQWALVTLKTRIGAFGKAAGPILRASSHANTMYIFHAEGSIGTGTTVLEIRKCVDGRYTTLASTGPNASVNIGDRLYFQAVGPALVAKHNGVVALLASDAEIATGHGGIGIFSDTGGIGDAALGDFVGGSF